MDWIQMSQIGISERSSDIQSSNKKELDSLVGASSALGW